MRSILRTRRLPWAISLLLTATLAGPGCTTFKATGSSRSGTEQLLLTGAWDAALCPVDFGPISGRKVYVDPQFVSVADKDWILSSLRRRMAAQGVLIENDKAKADLIVEPALGAYGTDDRSCTVGLPSFSLSPSMLSPSALIGAASTSSSSSSALTLSQANKSDAVVKAAIYAYDAKDGHLVWDSGVLLNAEGVRDHLVVGSGPYRISSLPEVEDYPSEAQSNTRRAFLGR
jgi:hypothetical protein